MRILQSVADLSFASGGPSRSVVALADSLACQGHQVAVMSAACSASQQSNLPRHAGLIDVGGNGARARALGAALARAKQTATEQGEDLVIHDNGVWLPFNHTVARRAAASGVARCVSPRGMLLAWSLRHHAWRKRIAMALYQRRDLSAARMLFATSEEEADALRALKLTQPIAVIPNGVHVPAIEPAPPSAPRPRTALFLSRLHPKKGLHDLLSAWARLRPRDWRLIVAGGHDNAYGTAMRARATQLHVEDSVSFVGEVAEAQKWPLYRSCSLFILPTYSENFGLAIAEAMAAGVPVITTTGAPWRAIQTERLGWWIAPGENTLVETLREALDSSDAELAQMGNKGRRHIAQNFAWSSVAERTAAAYAWLMRGGPRPPEVKT